jgi:hypothetical protein
MSLPGDTMLKIQEFKFSIIDIKISYTGILEIFEAK